MTKQSSTRLAKNGLPLPPRRFHFAIFVATPEEQNVVARLLPLKRQQTEPPGKSGRTYMWGYINSTSVALVCANGTGSRRAIRTTNWIVSTLSPDYLLIVGHGCGISRKDGDNIKSGQIFISTGSVRSGQLRLIDDRKPAETEKATATTQFNPDPIKEGQVIPPSRKLSDFALTLAGRQKWKEQVISDEREIISVDDLARAPNATLRAVMAAYPRCVMWDMEAGAVADALTEAQERFVRIPDYFVIKGISDFHELWKEEEEITQNNTDQRLIERDNATTKAANFARDIITFAHRMAAFHRPFAIHRLLPASVGDLTINQCVSGVLHNVRPSDYSRIAEFNFQRCLEERNGQKTIFTVCAFEPKELWDVLELSYREQHNNPTTDVDELRRWASQKFPHFDVFSRHAKDNPEACNRILLLRDDRWSTDRLQKEHWELFWKLNGDVTCWGAIRKELQNDTRFLTDYCVIGGSLVLDYYEDSETLLVSDALDDRLKTVLLGLLDLFNTQRESRFISDAQLKQAADTRLITPPLTPAPI